MTILAERYKLPCGLELKNRLTKAAMTEGLATPENHATSKHVKLYNRWANGGVGLQLTGNIQVDRRNLERPGNVVVEGEQSTEQLKALEAFAAAGKLNGTHIIAQISHAGRQTQKIVNERPDAPSSVKLNMPGGLFGVPRALPGDEIKGLIEKFAFTAKTLQQTGFDGIQIHAAHGYLISQFLNPLANVREDEWGGPIENRARLLLDVIKACRAATSSDFAIGIKLNSADFQSGGFSHEDCLAVIDMLNPLELDFLEVTGGTYEQAAMMGDGEDDIVAEARASTIAREAYFANYTKSVRSRAKMPIMATGGFRSKKAMEEVIEADHAALIGLGRPLCVDPDAPQKLLAGQTEELPAVERSARLGPGKLLGPASPLGAIRMINMLGLQGWFCMQLLRMGAGDDPQEKAKIFSGMLAYQSNENKTAKAYRATLDN